MKSQEKFLFHHREHYIPQKHFDIPILQSSNYPQLHTSHCSSSSHHWHKCNHLFRHRRNQEKFLFRPREYYRSHKHFDIPILPSSNHPQPHTSHCSSSSHHWHKCSR